MISTPHHGLTNFHTFASQTLGASIEDFTGCVTWCLELHTPVPHHCITVRWVGHVAHIRTKGILSTVLVGKNLRENDHWEDLDVDGGTFNMDLKE
jgi:hypothetical protein